MNKKALMNKLWNQSLVALGTRIRMLTKLVVWNYHAFYFECIGTWPYASSFFLSLHRPKTKIPKMSLGKSSWEEKCIQKTTRIAQS